MAHMKCYVASRRKWQLVSRRDRRADVHVKLRKKSPLVMGGYDQTVENGSGYVRLREEKGEGVR